LGVRYVRYPDQKRVWLSMARDSGAPGGCGILGGRIEEVGLLPGAEAATSIDATGLVVAPASSTCIPCGLSSPCAPRPTASCTRGSPRPWSGSAASPRRPPGRDPGTGDPNDGRVLGRAGEPLPWERWTGFKTYLEDLSRAGTSLNVVPLVGQERCGPGSWVWPRAGKPGAA